MPNKAEKKKSTRVAKRNLAVDMEAGCSQESPTSSPNASATATPVSQNTFTWIQSMLARPVSGTSLAIFRISLGLVMLLEAFSLVRPSTITMGNTPLETYYAGPGITFNFPYAGLGWLPLLPSHSMHILVGVLGFASILVALGLFFRASAITLFVLWGYLFGVESTRTYWQSYYYMELLFTFLLVWLPAARCYSLDSWLRKKRIHDQTVPFWTIFLLRSQLLITYFFAGVAKLNADWLLDAAPLRWDLREPHVVGQFAPYLSAAKLAFVKGILSSTQLAYFLSYAGAAFDLSIGFLFLFRRTRIFALILMVIFHATNHFVIYDNIDWFPLMGITTALIFLDPDWPERFWKWLRRPHLERPDWRWFGPGIIVFPLVGAALGWKLKPPTALVVSTRRTVGRWGIVLLFLWLAWQVFLPIRQYLIPGDARITWEGLAFSWRLKTDDHFALAAQIFVHDDAIIRQNASPEERINWKEWHGEKVIYRKVIPGNLDWSKLPEIVVLIEPLLGERIIYNPLAAAVSGHSEEEYRQRVNNIWSKLYGRSPRAVVRTRPLAQTLEVLSNGLRTGGAEVEAAQLAAYGARTKAYSQSGTESDAAKINRGNVFAALKRLCARDPNGEMLPFLRDMDAFALEGGGATSASFLFVDDPGLFHQTRAEQFRLNQVLWKNPSGAEFSVIYTGDAGPEINEAFPEAAIYDFQDHSEQLPQIRWNCFKDLTASKFEHISNQPFYLRRYAHRVAKLWQDEYGRKPTVTARTAVSLNRRPYQMIVDPDVDLATVSRKWFGHNSWIKDLETARIPREALFGARK